MENQETPLMPNIINSKINNQHGANENAIVNNNPNPANSILEFCVQDNSNNIYSIIFIMKQNTFIRIECNDIESQFNEKYVNELCLNEWKNYGQFFSSFINIFEIFNIFNKMSNFDFSINKMNENEIFLKIKFSDKYRTYPVTIILQEIKIYKPKTYEIKNSVIEQKPLKNENKSLEERIEILEDCINKMKLSISFNSFDNTLYELEKVFTNLGSYDLIWKRQYLGFINSGIKTLFKTNIRNCFLVYKFSVEGGDDIPNALRPIIEGLTNSLIIIRTMTNRTFGAFYKKQNIEKRDKRLINDIIEIFDSGEYTSNSFVFSLDNSKIYYSDISHKDSFGNPKFNIIYDINRGCLCGNEYIDNKSLNFSTTNIINERVINNNMHQMMAQSNRFPIPNNNNQNKNENTYNIFILSGKKEFIISKLEVYEINL